MENEKSSGDVLGTVSDSMAKQILCDLLSVQATRARMMLENERRDSHQLQRILATAGVMSVLLHVLWVSWL